MNARTLSAAAYLAEIDELHAARERALRAGDGTTAVLIGFALRSLMNRRRSAQIAKRRIAPRKRLGL